MLGVATGVTNLVSNGTEVGGLPNQLGTIGNQAMLGGWVTTPVIVTAVVVTLAALVLARTRFGLRTYAIGSNSGAARRSGIGIRPGRITVVPARDRSSTSRPRHHPRAGSV